MVSTISREEIPGVLKSASGKFIAVSFSDHSGMWTRDYFDRYEVREVKHPDKKTTLVVLCFTHDEVYSIVDIASITGIKFNKYLDYHGDLLDQLHITNHASILQVCT